MLLHAVEEMDRWIDRQRGINRYKNPWPKLIKLGFHKAKGRREGLAVRTNKRIRCDNLKVQFSYKQIDSKAIVTNFC